MSFKDRTLDLDKKADGIWCLIANFSRNIPFGDSGTEFRSGTNLFRGGAKAYVIGAYRGGSENIVVVCQHRNSSSFLKCVVSPMYLINLRPKLIYHPKVLEIRTAANDTGVFLISTKQDALEIEEMINDAFVRENIRKLNARQRNS